MTRLTKEATAAYRDERHRTSDPWRAGGDRGLDEKANEAFYYVRLGLILRMLANRFGRGRALRILDAGCGRGWFTARLKALGHDVVGVDVSEEAIRRARETCDAPFFVAPLDGFVSDRRFDAIISVDVLYHITDDDQWRRSFRSLSGLLDDKGVLIFSDWLEKETCVQGDYIVHRSRREHDLLMADLGLTIAVSDPYGAFSPASMHMCIRSELGPPPA